MKKVILTLIFALLYPNLTLAFEPIHLFTDQEKDFETGLYNYGSREYDPNFGRFIQQDPVLKDGSLDAYFLNSANQQELSDFLSNPQNLNTYSYTRNNPVNYVDPRGEQPVPVAPVDVVIDPMYISESYSNMQSQQTAWSRIKFGADLALLVIPFVPMITTMEKTVETTRGLLKLLGQKLGEVGKKLSEANNKLFHTKNVVIEMTEFNSLSKTLQNKLNLSYDINLAGTRNILEDDIWKIEINYRKDLGQDQSLSRIIKYRNKSENSVSVYHEVIDPNGNTIHRDLK